jgi:hypothetical protein
MTAMVSTLHLVILRIKSKVVHALKQHTRKKSGESKMTSCTRWGLMISFKLPATLEPMKEAPEHNGQNAV